MPKDESTNSNAAESPRNGRSWSAGVIAGVAAAGLGLLMAAGISGAAIGQAVEHSHRDKPGSSEMRDHGKNGPKNGQDGRHGDRDRAQRDGQGMEGPGMQGPGMEGPGMEGPGMNEPGDGPVTGQSPSDPSETDRDGGERSNSDRGDRPPRMG